MSEERLCGERSEGVYGECGLSPFGRPLEEFLFCPPQPIPEWISVPALGVVVAQWYDGRYHVFDRVGLPYLNVTDVIEEVRYMGASRRYSPSLPFHLLEPGSGMFLIHPRAYINNWKEYGERLWRCPKTDRNGKRKHDEPLWRFIHPLGKPDLKIARHSNRMEFCSSLWWEDVEGGEHIESWSPRAVCRQLASSSYEAFARPEGVEPQYTEMIFAWLPLTRLVTVAGSEEANKKHMAAIGRSSLPIALVKE